jgi:hypothetical protein
MTYKRLSGTSVQRIEALSDALFGIALTVRPHGSGVMPCH